MRALCWYGKEDLRVEKVPDPAILDPHDAIIGKAETLNFDQVKVKDALNETTNGRGATVASMQSVRKHMSITRPT